MRGLEISSNDWAAGLCRCGEDWSESVSSHLSVIFTLCDSSLPAPRTNLKCSHPWRTLHLMQSAPDNWKGNATFILRMFSILFQTLKKITQPHNWLPLHPVSFTFKLVCTIISTSTSTLCLVLSLLFLLCVDFIHLVSVRFLDGSMRVTLCLYVLSVPTSLGLRKHTLSALSKGVPLSFCTICLMVPLALLLSECLAHNKSSIHTWQMSKCLPRWVKFKACCLLLE